MNQDQQEALEARVTFLDAAVSDLQESIVTQQRQILDLEARCALLTEKLKGALEALDVTGGAEHGATEIPPHY